MPYSVLFKAREIFLSVKRKVLRNIFISPKSITKQHYMACSVDLSDKKIQSELQISDGDSVGWCISSKNKYTACHPKDCL